MPEGRRLVVVIEYELDRLSPDVTAQIGQIVRERMVERDVAGAVFVAAHALVGSAAFRVVELLPPKT